MGCVPSREDDPPLVTLCRQRKLLLKSAADRRFALAAAHIAYFTELRDVGNSLCRFVEEELILSATSSPSTMSSPVLTLPSDDVKKTTKKPKTASDLRDDDGSHLNLSSFSSSDGHLDIDDVSEEAAVEPQKKVQRKAKKKPKSHEPGVSYIPATPSDNYSSNNYSYPNFNFNPAYYPPPPDDFSNYSSYNANPAAPVYPPSYYNAASSNYYPENYDNYANNLSSYTTFYMKKSSAQIPSVIYEEPVQNPIYSYSHYPPSGDYPDYVPPNAGGGGGYSGFVMGREEVGSVSNRQQNQEKQRPPPPVVPTPPTPQVSAWDYFNPFDFGGGDYYSQEMHGYESKSSSPDSREVREREGIPDLEEETESEVMKEPYTEKRKVHEEFSIPKSKNKHVQFEDFGGRNSVNNTGRKKKKKKGGNFSEKISKTEPINSQRKEVEEEQESFGASEQDPFRSPDLEPLEIREEKRSIPETDSSISTTLEDVFMKKKGVSFDVGGTSHLDMESSKPSSLTTLSNHGTRDLREVVREIKDEFEAATDYGKEVSVLLEVDKERYRSRNTFLKVILARVCSATLSSYHSPSSLAEGYPETAEDDLDPRSLASTLDKLYAWEKKLYKEVKDEERLRVMYEKQCERLKDLDDRGAETSKIEASQATVRKLLTKINVSVRAIDSISSRIHKLRDDELQPQLKELIYGLRRMWKLLFKCHQKQFQAILESKIRTLKANTGFRRDSNVRATIQLEAELLKWCHRFHHWIDTQRSYAEALNNWLEKCLIYEPENTSDGPIPYSPGRIGAPQVFITCHDWKDAMKRISDSTVQTTLHDFATSLHQLWESQDEEQRRRLTYKDFEKQISAAKTERERREHHHHHHHHHDHDDHDGETSSEKNSLSMVATESGMSGIDDLDSIKQRMREERAGHKEAVKMVHEAVSRSIQGGLVPIFEALESFTSEASKAFDEVRLENVRVNG